MVKVVKLINGEDIVSDIEFINEETQLVLKNPQRFMATAEGVGSIPFVPFSNDETYTINMSHVILIAEPDPDIKNGYNSQFGSGIVLPNNKVQL